MLTEIHQSIYVRIAIALVVLVAAFAAVPAQASTTVLYVKSNAGGANNGTSWANAYTGLQSALVAASDGDSIWVAVGTYKPTSGNDRSISFVLKNGVTIYGGFAGTETLLSQRDPAVNLTVLSGEIAGVGITDNSFHVVVGSSTDKTAILDGFTITSGNANGPSSTSYENGGGLYNDNGSPSLANLVFSDNFASLGGGIANYNSSPSLLNISFVNNSAEYYGGGLYNNNSSPSLLNATFSNNSAVYGGGGMGNYENSNPNLINVTLNGNSASHGGGMDNYFSSPSLTNVTVKGNTASNAGGGMKNYMNNSTIRNSIFYGNSSGEVVNESSAPDISYSIVQGGYSGLGNLNKDPLLGPLQNNGGFTQTMALLAGSPAINTGSDTNCPATDQRWVTRPQGSHCDIGAYEYEYQKSNGGDTTGVFRPSNGALYLKNTNDTGFADVQINYGVGGDYPITGDWDGDGVDTIGIYRNGYFYLRNSNTIGYADYTFPFGAPGDQPVAGDWNGDGKDTIGVYRNGTFYLRNSNDSGAPDMIFALGVPGDVAIAGDWTGKGYDTTGVFRPSNGALYLKNKNETGFADVQINYGVGGDKPVTGDWNDDGVDTIGVLRGNVFCLRNENTIGYADIVFALGNPGDMPIAGNWDGKP